MHIRQVRDLTHWVGAKVASLGVISLCVGLLSWAAFHQTRCLTWFRHQLALLPAVFSTPDAFPPPPDVDLLPSSPDLIPFGVQLVGAAGFSVLLSILLSFLLFHLSPWKEWILKHLFTTHTARALFKVLVLQSLDPKLIVWMTVFFSGFMFEWLASPPSQCSLLALVGVSSGDSTFWQSVACNWNNLMLLMFYLLTVAVFHAITLKLLPSTRVTKSLGLLLFVFGMGTYRTHYALGGMVSDLQFTPLLLQVYIPQFPVMLALGTLTVGPTLVLAHIMEKQLAPAPGEKPSVTSMMIRVFGQFLSSAMFVMYGLYSGEVVARAILPDLVASYTFPLYIMLTFDALVLVALVFVLFGYYTLIRWLYVTSPVLRIQWQQPLHFEVSRDKAYRDMTIVDSLQSLIGTFRADKQSIMSVAKSVAFTINALQRLRVHTIAYRIKFKVPVRNKFGPYFRLDTMRMEVKSLYRHPGAGVLYSTYSDGPTVFDVRSLNAIEVRPMQFGEDDPVDIDVQLRVFGKALAEFLARMRSSLPGAVMGSGADTSSKPYIDGFRAALHFDMGPLMPARTMPLFRCEGGQFVSMPSSPLVDSPRDNINLASSILDSVNTAEFNYWLRTEAAVPMGASLKEELREKLALYKDLMLRIAEQRYQDEHEDMQTMVVGAVYHLLDLHETAQKANLKGRDAERFDRILYSCSTNLFSVIWKYVLTQVMAGQQAADWLVLVAAAFVLMSRMAINWAEWRAAEEAAKAAEKEEAAAKRAEDRATRPVGSAARGSSTPAAEDDDPVHVDDPVDMSNDPDGTSSDVMRLEQRISKLRKQLAQAEASSSSSLGDGGDGGNGGGGGGGGGTAAGVGAGSGAGAVIPSAPPMPGYQAAEQAMRRVKVGVPPMATLSQLPIPDGMKDEIADALSAWARSGNVDDIQQYLCHFAEAGDGVAGVGLRLPGLGGGAAALRTPAPVAEPVGRPTPPSGGVGPGAIDLAALRERAARVDRTATEGLGAGGDGGDGESEDPLAGDGVVAEMRRQKVAKQLAVLRDNHPAIMKSLEVIQDLSLGQDSLADSLETYDYEVHNLDALGLTLDSEQRSMPGRNQFGLYIDWGKRVAKTEPPFDPAEVAVASKAWRRAVVLDQVHAVASKAQALASRTRLLYKDGAQDAHSMDVPRVRTDVADLQMYGRLCNVWPDGGSGGGGGGGGGDGASGSGAGAGSGSGSGSRSRSKDEGAINLSLLDADSRASVSAYLQKLRQQLHSVLPVIVDRLLAVAQGRIASVVKLHEAINAVTKANVAANAKSLPNLVGRFTRIVREILQAKFKSKTPIHLDWCEDAQREAWIQRCDAYDRDALEKARDLCGV